MIVQRLITKKKDKTFLLKSTFQIHPLKYQKDCEYKSAIQLIAALFKMEGVEPPPSSLSSAPAPPPPPPQKKKKTEKTEKRLGFV